MLPDGAEWARDVVTPAWLEHKAAKANAVPRHLAVARCMDEQCDAVRPRELHPRWESDEQWDRVKAAVNREKHCAGSSFRATLLDSERRVVTVVVKKRARAPLQSARQGAGHGHDAARC